MIGGKLLSASAAVQPTFIEDVFSTYLYTGNSSTQTITNGIDLAGEGGMVWLKARSAANSHAIYDTLRGNTLRLNTNTAGAAQDTTTSLSSFNSNGFSLSGPNNQSNESPTTYASWTFRKAPRFFDVVTWVGNGASSRQIAHNLGVAPGAIFVKVTGNSQDWSVYHRAMSTPFYQNQPQNLELILNATSGASYDLTAWGGAQPTATHFTVGTQNNNGYPLTYVAYLFAHDPLGPSGDGSDGLIACGSYTGTGGTIETNLGWEPQWILIKKSSGGGAVPDWHIYDNMRGIPTGGIDQYLRANLSEPEVSIVDNVDLTPTGFKSNGNISLSGENYIYIAIRRGPMREPTVGTQVFFASKNASSTSGPVPTGFPVDLFMNKATLAVTSSPRSWWVFDRMRGSSKQLSTDSSAAEPAFDYSSFIKFDSNTTFTQTSSNSDLGYFFRRAPGFFDVVAYTGTGSVGQVIPHNLGVAPELVITKLRNSTFDWGAYADYANNGNFTGRLYLNTTVALQDPSTTFFTKSASNLTVQTVSSMHNASGSPYIAYLFASLPGISKVGSYTGNGSSQTINCAFTTGARFVLIKRRDSTGDWYVWDTARGIVSGNDPHLSLNTTAAEVTSDDTIDPDNSGFIVNQVAATNVNVNAAKYIYLAIA